jgi:hypothetical protein
MSDWFLRGDYGAAPTNYISLVIGLLLAFVCGHTIAWVYMFTHTGLSYSRSYVNTLILMPVIVALVMAIFAMVRFRSILRDTLDTAYVLAVIVIGLACGTSKFTSAVIGCLATAGLMFYFWATSFGTRHRYDLIVNVQWVRPAAELGEMRQLLTRHSRHTQFASQRSNEGYPGIDLSYRLLLRDPARSQELIEELRALRGVARVSSVSAGDESEM